MAHFIGYVHGSRGEASRLGTKDSGITAKANGWDIGAETSIRYDEKIDMDIVTVYLTAGSNHRDAAQYLGQFVRTDENGYEALSETLYKKLRTKKESA